MMVSTIFEFGAHSLQPQAHLLEVEIPKNFKMHNENYEDTEYSVMTNNDFGSGGSPSESCKGQGSEMSKFNMSVDSMLFEDTKYDG